MSKTKTFVFISILAVLLGVALATLCVSSQSAEASTIHDYEEFYKRYYTDLGINDNLLLNSDFSKNSNGKPSYSTLNEFTVDRWQLIYGSLVVDNSYLTHTTGGAGGQGLRQTLSNVSSLANKNVVLTCKLETDQNIWIVLRYSLDGGTTYSNLTQTSYSGNSGVGLRNAIFTYTLPSLSSSSKIQITVSSTQPQQVVRYYNVKLEISKTPTAYVPNSEELYRDFMECNNPNFVDFFSTTGSSATVDGDNYVHDYSLSDYLTNNGINSTLLSHNSCLTFSIPEIWTSTTAGGNREFTCFWDAATQSYTDADNSFYFYLNEPCVTVSSKTSDLQLWKPKYIYIYDFGDVYNDGFNNGLTVGELYSQYEIIDKVDLSTVLTGSDFHDSVLSSGSVITSEDNPIGYSSIPWENSSTLNYINDNFSNLYLLLYDKNSSNFFLLTPSDDVIIDGVNYGNSKVF